MRMPRRSVRESSRAAETAWPEGRRSGACRHGVGPWIEIIRCQQRDALFVVSGIEDVPDGFQRPRRRLAGAEIVEEQNIGRQHGLEHAEFAGLAFRIVAALNFLEQFAVIVEKSRDARAKRFAGARRRRDASCPRRTAPSAAVPCRRRPDNRGQTLRRPAWPAPGCGSTRRIRGCRPRFWYRNCRSRSVRSGCGMRARARARAVRSLPVQSQGTAQTRLDAPR